MHPTKEQLEQFVANVQEIPRADIEVHVRRCDFCREYCESYRQLIEYLKEAESEPLSPDERLLAESLLAQAIPTRIIDLKLLSVGPVGPTVMAADTNHTSVGGVQCIAQWASESPELVLRLMHDTESDRYSLQVITDPPEQASGLLVSEADSGVSVVTDHAGAAPLPSDFRSRLRDVPWKVQLPDAALTLDPVDYDPDRTEAECETTLRSDRGDEIVIRFETKTEGRAVLLRVASLAGQTDFAPVQIAVSQGSLTRATRTGPSDTVSFKPIDNNSLINIRLYT
ncbi:MAG: hypothetical protein KKA42_05430 [candidate division Zixibacteria bacterium]|nr:hypothetical protein [candidate division Zixibacteria bacterium]